MPRSPAGVACAATAAVLAGALLTPAAADPAPPSIVIEDDATQPVFSHADAIREVVYVEAPIDSDQDGRLDRIAMDIMRPAETEDGLQVPIIVEASPYYRMYGAADQTKQFKGFWDRHFVPRGYAVAQLEMQGTSRSEGCPLTGASADTASIKAAVEWLAGEQDITATDADGNPVDISWSSGNVAMHGLSYAGTLPVAVATQGVKGLKTVVPMGAISNWYRYVNDHGVGWENRADDGYTDFLSNYVMSPTARVKCSEIVEQMVQEELASEGDYTDFWAQRDYLPDANKIKSAKTSVFMVHGLNDDNVKPTHFASMWHEVGKRNMPRKLWLHQYGHKTPYQPDRYQDWTDVMHRWMDHWLHDIDNGVMDEPMVDLQRPSGDWETHVTWPAADATPVKLRLAEGDGASGHLADGPTSGTSTASWTDSGADFDELIAQPDTARDDRLVFVTNELADEVRLSGTPTVDVAMSSDSTGGLLTAALVDYGPADAPVIHDHDPWTLLTEPCLRYYIDTGQECGTPAAVELVDQRVIATGHIDARNHSTLKASPDLVPGKQYRIDWTTTPLDFRIPEGHRIGLVLTSNYRAPDNATKRFVPQKLTSAVGAELTIKLNNSRLTLPVVGGAAALGG